MIWNGLICERGVWKLFEYIVDIMLYNIGICFVGY